MISARATAGPNNLFDGPLSAAAYDLFATDAVGWGPSSGDIAFYIDCTKHYGGPVLELGVGTGRVALQIAQQGFDVVGLDSSAEMLAVADRALSQLSDPCRQRVRFVKADIVDFSLYGRFPLAIVPARTFHHLTTPMAQRAALKCIRCHLNDNGVFVLHLFDPRLEFLLSDARHIPTPKEVTDQDTGRRFRRTTLSCGADPFRQIISEKVLFEEIGKSDEVIAREEAEYTLRWALRQEMAYLLEITGFEVIALYSDFHRAPPTYGKEQVWVVRRK